jgi:hypothetical protein
VVDVNTLPLPLLESVEVITGGASAVYGSDAIAGVVNFRTRRNFEGLQIDASYNLTEEGDGAVRDISGMLGGSPWTFAIINVSPARPPAGLPPRAATILRLFPNQAEYLAGERARWALTVDHWDERFVPLAWNQTPFSLYAPIENPIEPE